MISYNVYWIVVIIMFVVMRFRETKGHWPFMKAKANHSTDVASHSGSESREGGVIETKEPLRETTATATA